jgi:hypothetical protein
MPDIELTTPSFIESPSPEVDLMMETDACESIVTTYGLHGLDIGCATTIKACPGLFRDSFGVPCMQYEAWSVDACLDNIESAATCEEIRATSCQVAPVWGSEPLGCDEPE